MGIDIDPDNINDNYMDNFWEIYNQVHSNIDIILNDNELREHFGKFNFFKKLEKIYETKYAYSFCITTTLWLYNNTMAMEVK